MGCHIIKVCKQAKERWGIAKVIIGARESKGKIIMKYNSR